MTGALIVVSACTLALLVVVVDGRVHERRQVVAARRALDARAGGPGVVLSGTTPDGAPLSVALGDGPGRTLLAFLTSSCVTCRGLWAALADDLPASVGPGTRVVVVTEDPADERPAAVRDLAPASQPVLMSGETWARYGVTAAPFFVLIEGRSGRVLATGTAPDCAGLRRLARRAGR